MESNFIKTTNLKADKTRFIKTFIAVGLFSISGFASAYIFHLSEDNLVINSLYPGLLYISATILVFILTRTSFKGRNLLIYCVAMYATYLAAFYLTVLTSYFLRFVAGIVTGGFGAIVTFNLTNKFIRKITFNKKIVFVAGGLPFLINEFFLMPGISKAIEPIYPIDDWMHTMYPGTFLFWQIMVGTKLFLTLQKSE